MADFEYKAVSADGQIARGRLEAPDRASAVATLQSQGQTLLTLALAEPATGLRALLSREIGGSGGGAKIAADLIGRLSLLLEAGVALEDALALLAKSEGTSEVKELAGNLLQKLRAGTSLSDAMAAQHRTFQPIAVAMVRSGEASGALAQILGRLSDHLIRAEMVRQTIRSAMIYPAVLIATAVGAVLLVLLVVLPQLEPVFAEAGNRLPLPTRIAFGASSFIRQFWWALAATAGVLSFAAHRLWQDPGFCARRDAWLLRLPVLSLAVRRIEAARFSRVLGTLLTGGMTLAPALMLARPVLSNRVVVDAFERVISTVREGGGLAAPLAKAKIFPELAIQMIRIGESAGRLDSMLLRLADLLDSEVQRTIDRALALMVPILTIGLGAMVAGIIASVMFAVLGINDLLH